MSVGGKLEVGGTGAPGRVAREGWLERELKKRGVALEWLPVAGDTGPVINEAFASGRIQFASYGDLPSLILNAAGIRTQMVLPIGRGQDVYLLVPPNSAARSIKDLKGKRISLHRSRPWEMSFYKLAADNGLARTDFRLLNMEPSAGVGALAAGKVDGWFANNGLRYQARGVGKVIWSSANDYGKKDACRALGRHVLQRCSSRHHATGGDGFCARTVLQFAGRQSRGSDRRRHPQRHAGGGGAPNLFPGRLPVEILLDAAL